MAIAKLTRSRTVWIAAAGIALTFAVARYVWATRDTGTPIAGEAGAEGRRPASNPHTPTDETKQPERAAPPPGRFF